MIGKLHSVSKIIIIMLIAALLGTGIQFNFSVDGVNASGEDSVRCYLTISDDGEIVTGKDENNTAMARVAFDVEYFDLEDYGLGDFAYHDQDGNIVEKPSVMHLLIKAVEEYYQADGQPLAVGTEAYTVIGTRGSSYMSSFWGHDENLMYFVNHEYPLKPDTANVGATSDEILLKEGMDIDLAMFTDWSFYFNGAFAEFTPTTEEVETGQELNLTMIGTRTSYSEESYRIPMAGETVKTSSDNGKTWKFNVASTDSEGKVTLTFDKPGTYLVSAGPLFQTFKNDYDATIPCVAPPVSKVIVTGGDSSDPDEETKASIQNIKTAIGNTFTAEEGTHTNLLSTMQGKADKAASGSTISIKNTSNPAIDKNTGAISYGETESTGNTVLTILLNGITEDHEISTVIPKHETTAQDIVNQDAEALTWDKIKGQNTEPSNVRFNLKFPTSSESYYTSVTWKRSNEDVISQYGSVVRPPYGDPDASVTLTATVKANSLMPYSGYKGKTSPVEKEIKITVPAITKAEYDAAAANVDAVAARLSDEFKMRYYNDTSGVVDLDGIKGDISFNDPDFDTNGTTLTWGSSNSAINVNYLRGHVTRPEIGQSDINGELYVDISKNGYTRRVVFDSTVKALTGSEIEAELAYMNKVRNALDFDVIKGTNTDENNVMNGLSMVYRGYVDDAGNVTWKNSNTGNTGVVITWESSTGDYPWSVMRPPVGSDDKEVTLTATIESQNILRSTSVPAITKKITYTVKAFSNKLTDIKVNSQSVENFDKAKNEFEVIVPFESTRAAIDIVREDPTATVVAGNAVSNGTDKYTVDFENTDEKTVAFDVKAGNVTNKYTVKLIRDDSPEVKDEQLTALKKEKITEIENYLNLDNYKTVQQREIISIVSEAIIAINNARSDTAVLKILSVKKAELDEVKTATRIDLEDTAKSEIKSYVNKDDYRAAEKTVIALIISNALKDIENADGTDEISEIISNAKNELDSVKTNDELTAHENQSQVFIISSAAGEGGKITASGYYRFGSAVSYSYTPDKGYKVSKLYVDNNEVAFSADGGIYTFKDINADHSLSVYFEKDTAVLGQTAVTKKAAPKNFKVKAQKKKAKLTWKKSSGVTKYQIAYKKKGSKSWKYKTVSAKKNTVTIKKLKGSKKYQFKIRSYKKTDGKKVYSKWSKTKTVKIKK